MNCKCIQGNSDRAGCRVSSERRFMASARSVYYLLVRLIHHHHHHYIPYTIQNTLGIRPKSGEYQQDSVQKFKPNMLYHEY
jgi:hypothetical protein